MSNFILHTRMAHGLLTECLWFFHAIFAMCSAVVPTRSKRKEI